MSAREWKPGDVARVTFDNGTTKSSPQIKTVVAVRDEGWWAMGKGKGLADWQDACIREVHPLVVIDPDSREQVERLDGIYQAALDSAPKFHSLADVMQAALREFANPTPPKSDEPTGLGAVVEDAEGHKWTRANSAGEWFCECGDDIYETWDKFPDPVRVLSEGVSDV